MCGEHFATFRVGDDKTIRRQRMIGAVNKFIAQSFEILLPVRLETSLIRLVALVLACIEICLAQVLIQLFALHKNRIRH